MNLEKATAVMDYSIRKAMAGGFQLPFEEPVLSIRVERNPIEGVDQLEPYVRIELDGDTDFCIGLPGILFDIDFARALWPGFTDMRSDEVYETRPAGFMTAECWKVNLQMLAISTERIRYMAKASGYAAH